MNTSTLHKIQKACSIALIGMLAVAVVLVALYFINRDDGDKDVKGNKKAMQSKNVIKKNVSKTEKKSFDSEKYMLYKKLPELSFTKANGEKLTLKSMKGKTVILNFWVSWCPYCKKELAQYQAFRRMLRKQKGIEYYLVDRVNMRNETKAKAKTFLKKNKIFYKNIFDVDSKEFKRLHLEVVPTTLVIDKNGFLRAYHSGGGLTPNRLESMIEYTQKGGGYGVRNFITKYLTTTDGGIKSKYLNEKGASLGNRDILSESQGLLMEYAVLKKEKGLFQRCFDYINNKMRVAPLASWLVKENSAAKTNATIDDLRIYKALSAAEKLWGGYSNQLQNYEKALYRYNTQNQKLVNSYDFEHDKKSDQLKLCYADFKALKLLSEQNKYWKTVYDNSLSIVTRGYISEKFPMFYSMYDYGKKEYLHEDLNMAEEMVTLLHLAEEGKLPPKTLEWLKRAINGDGIFARYHVDGSVVDKYNYESTAIYGLASLIGSVIGDRELENKALIRTESMRIFDKDKKTDGAFGNSDGTGIFSFDQCIALLTYSAYEDVNKDE